MESCVSCNIGGARVGADDDGGMSPEEMDGGGCQEGKHVEAVVELVRKWEEAMVQHRREEGEREKRD